MNPKFIKPDFHYVHNTGELSNAEIARLPENELVDYLQKNNFGEEKKKYRIKPGFVLREIAGEYAIVPVDAESFITNAVMIPNDSAVFLWKAFEQPSTKEDVVQKGLLIYDAAEETIRNAVCRFMADTLEYKILEEVK